jgi:hypothetical protein
MNRASLAALLALSLPLIASAQQTDSTPAFSSSRIVLDSPAGGAIAEPSASGVSIPMASSASIHSRPFSGLAVGANVGILGIGFEAATPLSRKFNLRAGASFFNYTDSFNSDGINYDANLHFRSSQASLDWFPWARSFHVSPGMLLYNGNKLTATGNVPAGQTFTLNDVDYTSSATDPVSGNGSLTFSNKVAPKLTVGWGNLLPRSGRHFSVPFEVGFAYMGDPTVKLNLNGVACYKYEGQNYCDNVATNPDIQSNLAAQRQKLANNADDARFFPLLSAGFAYSF